MTTIRSRPLAIIVTVAIAAGISVSAAAGFWNTESTKVPRRISEGEFEGDFDPGDIRGSYTFADIENSFDVPVPVLAAAFGVSNQSDAAMFRAGDLEGIFEALPDGGEVGTDSIRLFVSLYTGIQYVPEETTRLPAPALGALKDRLTPADLEAASAISVPISGIRIEGAVGNAEEHDEEHDEDAQIIRGNTTFSDLSDWGVSDSRIESVLGVPPGPGYSTIRDYVTEQGLKFGEVKTSLQEIIDAAGE